MQTLKYLDAIKIDEGTILTPSFMGLGVTGYNPAASYTCLYWNLPSFSTNVRFEYELFTGNESPEGTFVMVFGASNDNDPRSASNSVYIEVGCVTGKFAVRLCKRTEGVLVTQLNVTTENWYVVGGRALEAGLDSISMLLKFYVETDTESTGYQLAIPAYSFNRIYAFGTTASATPPITFLSYNGPYGGVLVNDGFIYNKNKTQKGNMLDFISYRIGTTVTAADVIFSNIIDINEYDAPTNTRVTVTSNSSVLVGSGTLDYFRFELRNFTRVADGRHDLTIAEPANENALLAAFNAQYGLNLQADEIVMGYGFTDTFIDGDNVNITMLDNSLCITSSTDITLYHPT